MKKIKYGIIGAGTMAREHILNISLIDNAEVVALSDPHEDSLNQCKEILKTNVSCFKRHQEMIKENIVDVYLISSPNFTHIDILKDVIKTKKHILVEKPLCTNTKDCLEIKKLTKDYPSVFWTAMEYRYMPPVSKFIKEIHNNTIGDLKKLYSYSEISYVGGGMGNTGLHNILEACIFEVPVIIGKNYKKFNESIELVKLNGVISIKNQNEFNEVLNKLIENEDFRIKKTNIIKNYFNGKTGATNQIIKNLTL